MEEGYFVNILSLRPTLFPGPATIRTFLIQGEPP
jgi:hypothetical protein